MKYTRDMLTQMKDEELKDEYNGMVARLEKDPATILASLTPEKVSLWHMETGVSGEAGELADAIKRYVVYGKPCDRTNVIEELGDLEFYMQGIRARLGISREETLEMNMLKLAGADKGRYKEGYSDAAAIERADKQLTPDEETERIQAIMHEQAASNRK